MCPNPDGLLFSWAGVCGLAYGSTPILAVLGFRAAHQTHLAVGSQHVLMAGGLCKAWAWLPTKECSATAVVACKCPSQTHTLQLDCCCCSHGAFSAFNKHFSASASCLQACGFTEGGVARWEGHAQPLPCSPMGTDTAPSTFPGKTFPLDLSVCISWGGPLMSPTLSSW